MALQRALRWGVLVMTWSLFGCEGDGPSVINTFTRGPVVWSSFVYAIQEGGLLLQVHNPPFGDAASVGQAAVEQFKSAFPEQPGRLTLDASQAREPTQKIVLVFDPPPKWDARNTCRGERPVAQPEAGRTRVQASYCNRDELLAAAEGWVKNARDPRDERFGRLMTQIALNLITRDRNN